MASAANRASTVTTLRLGAVSIEVGLHATAAKAKDPVKFDTAGPNGGVLKYGMRGRAVAVEDVPDGQVPVRSDPLADDAQNPAPPAPTSVPGEYVQVLVEEGTGEVVERDDVRRGVRLEDGSFVDCSVHLAAIEERTRLDAMDILGFIDVAHVPRSAVKGSYYVAPRDVEAGSQALRLIFEACRQRRAAAVVKWTKRSRQALGVIAAQGRQGVLVLLELEWAENIREAPKAAAAIQRAEVTESMVEAACSLVESMRCPPSVLDEQRDDALVLREELLARASAGELEAVPVAAAEPEPDGVGLEALLAESLALRQGG